MKIALYQPWIYLHGGIERSILELVQRSEHQWTIFTSHYEPENTFSGYGNLEVIELASLSVDRDILSVLKASFRIALQKIQLSEYDCLVIWCDGLGDMAVFRNHEKPIFNICSTPLRPVYDPVYIDYALKSRPLLGRLVFHIFRRAFDVVDRHLWKKYDGVIATSREVKQRIIKGKLYEDCDEMKLFYPGIDWDIFSTKHGLHSKMLLVPGRIMWTKNIGLAIRAFIRANLPEPWKLIVAGFVDKKSKVYLDELRFLAKESSQIIFEESPSEDRLKELYKSAELILFPPLNEDWGIVPLEAMANGKPVIANNSGGPSESILHGQTGWLLDPTVEAWAEQLETLPDNRELIEKMGTAARLHVRRYDWSQFVEGVDNALEQWVTN